MNNVLLGSNNYSFGIIIYFFGRIIVCVGGNNCSLLQQVMDAFDGIAMANLLLLLTEQERSVAFVRAVWHNEQ